jgi:hypothetical protein
MQLNAATVRFEQHRVTRPGGILGDAAGAARAAQKQSVK